MHPAVSGALYHSHTGNPRAGRGTAPVAVLISSGCESRDRQGIPAPATLSPVRRAMIGITAVLWPHGGPAVYMKIKTC